MKLCAPMVILLFCVYGRVSAGDWVVYEGKDQQFMMWFGYFFFFFFFFL